MNKTDQLEMLKKFVKELHARISAGIMYKFIIEDFAKPQLNKIIKEIAEKEKKK